MAATLRAHNEGPMAEWEGSRPRICTITTGPRRLSTRSVRKKRPPDVAVGKGTPVQLSLGEGHLLREVGGQVGGGWVGLSWSEVKRVGGRVLWRAQVGARMHSKTTPQRAWTLCSRMT